MGHHEASGAADTGVSRRRFIQASSIVPLAVAAAGAGQAGASAAPLTDARAKKAAFDVSRRGVELFTNRYVQMVRTTMQSLAVDIAGGHVYVLQLVQANTDLPGDEPGDTAYARRLIRGDLSLTKLDLAGNRRGHMYLKHFGHGVSMGIERDHGELYFWTEIDTLPNAAGEGRGSRLTRFQFADGAVIDAEHDSGLYRRELLPDITETTCNIDPVNNRLVMRYLKAGTYRYALFDLDQVKEERESYEPLYDIASPVELQSVTFQGYASFGDYLYTCDGTAYNNTDNPPPPDGTGNTHLNKIKWSTGLTVQHADELAGVELNRREPEGLTVALGVPGKGRGHASQPRLYSGFTTSGHESVDADRLFSVFYRDAHGA